MLSTKKLILFILLSLTVFVSCKHVNKKIINGFYTSVEISETDSAITDIDNPEIIFNGLKLISDSIAKTGKFSIKLDTINKYALGTSIFLDYEKTYELSFWKHGDNDKVMAVIKVDSTFYLQSSAVTETDSSGWQKVSLIFALTSDVKKKPVSLYIWNAGSTTVFVDDFKLTEYKYENTGNSNDLFWIYIDDTEYRKIQVERDKAFKQGVLTTDDNSWVKAMVILDDQTLKVKMRLKGDWLDHLAGKKWSYRIKIRSNNSYKGMMEFSIQTPKARHFIDQWLLYTLFREEGLLAPRYGFISGQLNSDQLGVYAYEEHFKKQLVESSKRREGPILKNTEESFWDLVIANQDEKRWYNYPVYEASRIEPFGIGKTIKNPTLYAEFLIAQNLVYQHKYGLTNVSELFDIDKAAKYWALTNVMQGYHGLRWHNQRYYYNPITSKLEYIVYDNYVGEGIYELIKRTIFGDFNRDFSDEKPEITLNYYLYRDTAFVNAYVNYLQKYSQKQFWDSVFLKYNDEITYYQSILIREFPQSHFNRDQYYSQAQKIQDELPAYTEKIKNGLYNNITIPDRKPDFYNETPRSFFINHYVNVYTQQSDGRTSTVKVVNFYPDNLKIVGYIKEGKKTKLSEQVVKAYKSGDYSTEVKLKDIVDSIVLSNDTSEFNIAVMPWPEPQATSPRQELEKNNKFPNQQYYTVENNKVIFSGKQTISELILIPQNYIVEFKAGTEIDFTNQGGFLSYSNVVINGTKDNPVKIYSSDKSARGFTVLQAPKIEMNYAVFDGLNTFDYEGWTLSGAVTLYESDVKINHCSFINNQCEDDLNIVRSTFIVSNSLLENTFADAFDSDFCTGTVDNCTFIDLGNDAIDFSTSKISIKNCSITNAVDKGVSGGEASNLIVENCTINGANIGIASKDKSVVEINNTQINNTIYVLTIFKKKPEYGEAKIVANNLKYSNFVQFYLIEKNSVLILDNKKIDGAQKNVADLFY